LSAVSPNTRTIELPSWKTLKYPPWNFLRVYRFLVEYSAAGAAITAFGILGVACVLFYFERTMLGGIMFGLILITVVLFVPFSFKSILSVNSQISPKTSTTSTTDAMTTDLYTRKATNPKDMAFGMWVMLERKAARVFETPTYTQEVGDVYRIFTSHVAQVTNPTDVLIFAAARSYTGQPSWVPDCMSVLLCKDTGMELLRERISCCLAERYKGNNRFDILKFTLILFCL
jgi:hypothetical protein